MRNINALWIMLIATALFMSCGEPASEYAAEKPASATETASTTETGPDPTVVDADHYKTEFENDRVRIIRINYGAGEESVMHFHPESVGVYLTSAHVEMKLPNGETLHLESQQGAQEFYPAGQHLPKNAGEQPIELVLIEFKAGATGTAIPDGQDSTVVDPSHYTTEFENDLVRIVRINYGAGEESTMHYHPDSVAVFLTDHHVQMTLPDGSTVENQAAAGDAMFAPAGQHLPKNIADSPLELVLVELK